MPRRELSPKIAWGLVILGLLYGGLCAVLILADVIGPSLWFTVIAMGFVAMTGGIQLISHRRRRGDR